MSTPYQEFTPPEHLKPFVECFWTHQPGSAVLDYPVLPDGCVDIVYSPGRTSELQVVGAMTSARKFTLVAGQIEFGMRFRPAMSQSFLPVPGLKTTAYLTLKLLEPNFEAVVTPFDKILEAVKNEVVDAGLLIHEGQLLFPQLGLHRVIDLGVWWHEQTGMPLPLGGNAVRRALGAEIGRSIARTIRDSVEYGLEHREEALNYAMQFARDMETELADKFVSMYVNRWTLGYGDLGKRAVTELIARGTAAGLLPGPATVEFLSEE